MPESKLPQKRRDITYQVGWKKGKIHNKAEQQPAARKDNTIGPKSITAFIWHKAPMLPASLDKYALLVLPLICIIAIVVLLRWLNQF